MKLHASGKAENNLMEKIIEFSRKTMSSNPSHGFDHVLRVVKFCETLGREEDADMEILLPAAYLHDIARDLEDRDPSLDHSKYGAKTACEFLKTLGNRKADEIAYTIEVHRFSTGIVPKTLEAKILQDADRLDALGAIGIYRTIFHSAGSGRELSETINHFEKKILKLKDMMNTESAKKIAVKRHEIVCRFVQSLKEDLIGSP